MIAVLVIFVALININRTYKSEVDLMLVSRNEATAKNMDRIIEDAKIIPLSVSFYDVIVSKDFEDIAEELPNYKREAYWRKKIKTERVDGSSIIRITIFDEDQITADDMSQEAALSMAEILSRYYNINTELDSRIVNGPMVSYGMRNNVFILILESLLGGLIFVFSVLAVNFILGILGIGGDLKKNRKSGLVRELPKISKEAEMGPISFDKKPADFKKIEKQAEDQDAYIQKNAFPQSLGRKSSAPENLPVADESIFQGAGIEPVKTEEIKKEKTEEKIAVREATPEEVKERLNRLLRGDL